MKVLTRQVT